MILYLVRRIAWAGVLLVGVTVITFIIFFLIPTDPFRIGRGTTVFVQDIRDATAIEGPIYEEYAEYVWGIVRHGSLGRSYADRREVNERLAAAAPVTASLILGGVIVWMLIAVPVGVLSALRPRSLLDRASMVMVLVGVSAHPVWIGLIFAYFFGVKLRLFPVSSYCDFFNPTTDCGGPAQWAYHLVLPWLTFATLFAALYVRMIRASVMETVNEDFVRTARAKGASELRVVRAHVLRNALLPVVTMLGMDIGIAFGGAIFVEQVYGLPGIGRLAVLALARRDLPMIMGVVIVTALAIIVFNLIVDILYGVLDPRIRLVQTDHEGKVDEEPVVVARDSVGQPA